MQWSKTKKDQISDTIATILAEYIRKVMAEHGLVVPQDAPRNKETKKRVNWDEQPLGTMTDTKLAKILGVHPITVHKARKARKIPPFKKR